MKIENKLEEFLYPLKGNENKTMYQKYHKPDINGTVSVQLVVWLLTFVDILRDHCVKCSLRTDVASGSPDDATRVATVLTAMLKLNVSERSIVK